MKYSSGCGQIYKNRLANVRNRKDAKTPVSVTHGIEFSIELLVYYTYSSVTDGSELTGDDIVTLQLR
jgi:hypothetical protein